MPASSRPRGRPRRVARRSRAACRGRYRGPVRADPRTPRAGVARRDSGEGPTGSSPPSLRDSIYLSNSISRKQPLSAPCSPRACPRRRAGRGASRRSCRAPRRGRTRAATRAGLRRRSSRARGARPRAGGLPHRAPSRAPRSTAARAAARHRRPGARRARAARSSRRGRRQSRGRAPPRLAGSRASGLSTCCQGRTAAGLRTLSGSLLLDRADRVGEQPILAPVPSAEHVARARRRDRAGPDRARRTSCGRPRPRAPRRPSSSSTDRRPPAGRPRRTAVGHRRCSRSTCPT